MTYAQQSIFSIIDEIATQHKSMRELKKDSFFLAWSKHVSSKKLLNSYLKTKFYERGLHEKELQSAMPQYF